MNVLFINDHWALLKIFAQKESTNHLEVWDKALEGFFRGLGQSSRRFF